MSVDNFFCVCVADSFIYLCIRSDTHLILFSDIFSALLMKLDYKNKTKTATVACTKQFKLREWHGGQTWFCCADLHQ